jgi:hypothetical protein
VAADRDDRQHRRRCAQGPGRLDAVHERHLDVDDDGVRLQRVRELDALAAVARLAHDLEARIGGERRGKRDAEGLVVLGDENPMGSPESHWAPRRLSARLRLRSV